MIHWSADHSIPKTGSNSGSPPEADKPQPPPLAQKTAVCSHCQHRQAVSLHGLSVFCKNCNRRINLTKHEGGRIPDFVRSSMRIISCPTCETNQDVPANALSAFCNKCGKRINMQNYQIRGKFNGDIQTKGTLTVSLGGDVRANVRVGNAFIEGKLLGNIIADGEVELRSTSRIEGDLKARSLVVHDGATLKGHCRVLEEG